MKTLSIDLPDEAAAEAEARARRAKMTLSEWVTARILGRRNGGEHRDSMGYPLNWFERTTGALSSVEELDEPADRPLSPLPPIELS